MTRNACHGNLSGICMTRNACHGAEEVNSHTGNLLKFNHQVATPNVKTIDINNFYPSLTDDKEDSDMYEDDPSNEDVPSGDSNTEDDPSEEDVPSGDSDANVSEDDPSGEDNPSSDADVSNPESSSGSAFVPALPYTTRAGRVVKQRKVLDL